MKMMKIGELAAAAQCTVETVRYYEKQGLLPPAGRSANNYRVYGSVHLDRLVFIRNCRALDMSQKEVASLLSLMMKPAKNCDAVDALLDEHMTHVDARIGELQRLKKQLLSLRRQCRNKSRIANCRILRGISHMRPGTRAPHSHV